MSERFVVACDGSPASVRALEFAVKEAGHLDASIVVAHVLEWLPYSFLTVEELEERHKRRGAEMERAKAKFLNPLVKPYQDQGIEMKVVVTYGKVAESLVDIIKSEKATQVFLGRKGYSDFSRLVFGSVASTMAQVAPVPCIVVP